MKIDEVELEETPEAVEIEEPKKRRRRGRPKGTSRPKPIILGTEDEAIPEQQTEAVKPFTLPHPLHKTSNLMAINVEPITFFDWWRRKLSYPDNGKSFDWVKPPEDKPQTKPRYTAYWYRKWPKIDPGLVGIKHSYIHKSHTWPFTTPEGEVEANWTKGTLALFGTGRYKVELVDYYASRTIANCEFEVSDWAYNPPKLNLDMVIMDSPDNKLFIQQCRARDIKLPGDEGYKKYLANQEESEDEMAAASAAVEVLGKFAERALDQQDRPSSSDGTSAVMVQQMGELVKAVIMARGDDGYKHIVDALREMKSGDGDKGMIDMIRTTFETQIESLKSQHETQLLVMREREKDNKAEIERLRRQLDETQQKLMDTRAELNKSTDIMSQIQRVNELKTMLDDGKPRPRRVELPQASSGPPDWLMPALQMAMPLLQQFMQQGQSQVAAQSTGTPVPQPAPATATNPSAGSTGEAANQPPPANPAPASAPSGAMDIMKLASAKGLELYGEQLVFGILTAYAGFLSMVAEPLVNHLLDEDLKGEDFATWLIDGYGETVYMQVKSIGAPDLVKAIITYAPIWDKIKGSVSTLELEEFADRFVNVPKFWEEVDEKVDDGKAEG